MIQTDSSRLDSTLMTQVTKLQPYLRVAVGPVGQEDVDGLDVVDGGRPVERRAAALVGQVDLGVGLDQLLHHALDGEPGGQDERGRAVGRLGVEVGGAVLD